MEIKKQTGLRGTLVIPGDKSISHRAVMFGSLAKGTTKISHFLEGADCLSTISCFRKMGIEIEHNKEEILVRGKGLHGLSAPTETLDVGNSGTTTRLISGTGSLLLLPSWEQTSQARRETDALRL